MIKLLKDYLNFNSQINESSVEKKVLSLMKHAALNVPYYQDLIEQKNVNLNKIKTLEDYTNLFPTSHAHHYRAQQQEKGHSFLIDNNIDIKNLMEDRSSGSSGVPISLYSTPEEFQYSRKAKTIHTLISRGLRPRHKVLAVVPTIQVVKRDFLMQRLGIFERTTIDYRYSPQEIVDVIKQKKINAIYGQAGFLRLLAEYYEEQKIDAPRLDFLCPGSEVIDKQTRDLFKRVFRPLNYSETYGSTETGIIASLNPSLAYEPIWHDCFFYLKDPEKISDNITRGSIVLTSLNNLSQPILNYEIGDIVHVENYSVSNFLNSTITSVEGRINDYLLLNNGEKLAGSTFYTLYEYFPFVKCFQVIQKEKEKCEIKVVLTEGLEQNKEQISNATKDLLENRIDYTVRFVPDIPLAKNGKTKILISDIN